MGGGTEKVNIIPISSPSQPDPPPITGAERDGDSGWALTPTCAAHSAVQMRPHLSAAHFMNVISSSVHHFPLQPAVPARHSSGSGAHPILHSGHPGLCLCRAQRARLSWKRPPTRVFLARSPSPQNFPLSSIRATWRGEKTHRGRVRLQTPCRKPGPLLFCLMRWTGELSAAPSSSVTLRYRLCAQRVTTICAIEARLGGTSPKYTDRRGVYTAEDFTQSPYFSMSDLCASPKIT